MAGRGVTPITFTKQGKPIYGYNEKGVPVCFAHPDHTERGPCMSIACMENGRCHVHGGRSLKGVDHPAFVHGGQSKMMPKSLLADFHRIARNPDLLSVRGDVALMELRIEQVLNKLEESIDSEVWDSIKSIVSRIEAFLSDPKMSAGKGDEGWIIPAPLEQLLRKLISVTEMGGKETELWKEIKEFSLTKAQLSGQEQKLLIAQQGMVFKEQVAVMMKGVAHAINTTINRALPPHEAEPLVASIVDGIAKLLTGGETDYQVNPTARDYAHPEAIRTEYQGKGITLVPIGPNGQNVSPGGGNSKTEYYNGPVSNMGAKRRAEYEQELRDHGHTHDRDGNPVRPLPDTSFEDFLEEEE